MRNLPSGWYLVAWGVSGFLTLFSGVIDGNAVSIFVGAVMAFGFTSAYLTSHVKSEHKLKKALEVILTLLTFGTVIFGYIITRSLILGVITIFIVAMIFLAFVASWLLPRIRSKPKNCGVDVKNEEKKKGDFAYNVGRELGREIRKGLEDNWKSHVIAGVIASGCGLFSILLKLPWWFIITAVFISYHAAYSALFKLFENKGERAKK